MRSFKKISAIVLVIAMLFSLATVSVFATNDTFSYKVTANGVDITTVGAKAGTNVNVEVYIPAGTYSVISFGAKCISEISEEALIAGVDFKTLEVNPYNAGDPNNYVWAVISPKTTVTIEADKPVLTIPMTIPSDATVGSIDLLTLTEVAANDANSDDMNYQTNKLAFEVKEGFDVASAVAVKGGAEVTQTAPIAVGMGTSLTKAVEGVTATLKNSDGTKTDPSYAITWDENAGYKPDDTTAVQEVTGKVTVDGKKTANATTEPVPVKAYIQVGKINIATDTDVVIDKVKDVTFQATKEAGTVAEDKILEEAAKITSVAVKKGTGYNGTLTLSNWAVSSATKTLESKTVSTITNDVPTTNFVTLTATATASGDIFEGTKAVTFYAYVVPAEIDGGSISINNPIDNGYVTANITVPADVVAKMPKIEDGDDKDVQAAKKAKRTVLVTVESKKNDVENAKGEYEFTNDDIDKAKAAVEAATAEKPADPITVPAIKVDKKMKELGYSSSSANKTFTVTVTVGGTQLVQKDKDGKVVPVSGEVKKATSGSAGGIHKGGSTTTTYAVTVVETKNGTATVSPEKAASGATVTVKPEPAEGYKVKSVTAVKADGTNVPVDEKAYTFTMPASAVKVTVEFEEGKNEPSVDPTPADDKFADVADDFWAAKDIYTLKDAGIIGGKSATEFDPEGDVTRAEFAKMVVGLFGYKATSDAVNFEDCKAEDWFTPYVAAGVEAGVIKGVSDTEFAPNATITREDACTILGRALNKVAQSNELKFTDADKVAEYAAPYVALLSELGYVNGYVDGSFAPTNNITRAEAAKIIAGIYNAKDTTVTEDKTEANVEGENTTAPVEENAEDVTPEK